MARLTKGMYGNQYNPTSNLFGIFCGQWRGGKTKFTHNSGWYNKLGEKLGWGDLSTKDLRRISKELKDDELFIVLGERDSYWNLTRFSGSRDSLKLTVSPTEQAPGVEYVAEHAIYIIARNRLYLVLRYDDAKKTEKLCGLRFKVINRETVKALMVATSPT